MILKKRLLWLTVFLSLVWAALLLWWLIRDPADSLTLSAPGMDKPLSGAAAKPLVVNIGENFSFFGPGESFPGAAWPGFRGPDGDNIVKEKIPLLDNLDQIGKRIRWKVELGEGHAGPAIYDGRVYVLDYDEKEKADALRCFSLTSGKELWKRYYHVRLKRNHGLSRTIPSVNDKFVVTIGPKCHVMCVDRMTGDLKWGLDLVKDYQTEVPFWYTGQCPVLAGDTVILAPGGTALMMAVDGKSGQVLWQTPNPRHWKMSHASVIRAVIEGKPTYVYFAIGGVCGVSASGQDTGKLLWELTDFAPAVVAPTPVYLGGGRVLLTAGYGAGTAVIRAFRNGSEWRAEIVKQFRPQEGIASEQQTPVFAGGVLYAILPKDAGGNRNQFVAVSPEDGTKILNTSGKTERYGLGPFLLADGKFFILNDDGEMTIATATATSFKVLDKAKILEGTDAWGPMAMSGGYLLARDSKMLICLDMKKP